MEMRRRWQKYESKQLGSVTIVIVILHLAYEVGLKFEHRDWMVCSIYKLSMRIRN